MMGSANDTGPDPAIQWYLVRDGQQHGPISDRELDELRRIGQLRSTDLLWRDGWLVWTPVATAFRAVEPLRETGIAGRVLLYLLAVVAPGFLFLIGDWRAFAPGTGPHWWERVLYPSGSAKDQRYERYEHVESITIFGPPLLKRPPPIPDAQPLVKGRRPSKAIRALKALCVMILASLGTGLIVGNPAAAIGAFLATGAILLFWKWFARS